MNSFERALAEAAVSRAETILRDFDVTGKGTPLHWVLARAKAKASDALVALVDADPEDAKAIRALQNDVTRFRDLVSFLRETIAEAEDANHALNAEDRDMILGQLAEAASSVNFEEGL
jgi:hypothetical protein